MKKIYINPEMEIVRLHTSVQMLAGSGPEDGFSKSGSGSLDGSDTSGNFGREGDLDDDF